MAVDLLLESPAAIAHFICSLMHQIFSEILVFMKRHWVHLLLGIPMIIGWTILHELAHCLAVWTQGGTVTDFVWLPGDDHWGYMSYQAEAFSFRMQQWVALAPYLIWTMFCLFAGVLAGVSPKGSFMINSTTYVWLFIAPVADIANAAIPYLLWGMENDLHHALGTPGLLIQSGFISFSLLIVAYGFWLNRKLYHENALGLRAYTILAGLAAVLVTGLTWQG